MTSLRSMFHTQTALSEPKTMCLSSGEKVAENILPVSPCNGPKATSPVFSSQIIIVSSSEPETIYLQLCEKVTHLINFVCPFNGPTTICPVCISQTTIVLSAETE